MLASISPPAGCSSRPDAHASKLPSSY
jgi:hypothetical protein